MRLELIAATTFGLEAVTKREIQDLGYEILATEDGKVIFEGDERAVVKANLWLRTADRIQIRLAEFMATESEELFQMIKGIPWEEWIPLDGKFIVDCATHKSKLNSVPKTQAVSEKAVVERLKETYPVERFEKTGALFKIKVTVLKDRVTVTLDTTGASLHKRGYRKLNNDAPIKETLASAMILLSFWKNDRILVDPCCGSGTIPIEAAMIGKNIAPGINREFSAEAWPAIEENLWVEERKAAREAVRKNEVLRIYGSDIDSESIKIAKVNAKEAGVENDIRFAVCDIAKVTTSKEYGVMVTNPPYGVRIGDERGIKGVYSAYEKFFTDNPTWSLFVITSDKDFEKKVMKREADRRRKLYNGRLEVCYYQFHGEKRRNRDE
ncbi:MAG: class I SAM-dependent RNA methyltransferase [Clostridia bacterium]|nr:class I SAM-dependent RNA methyltransferase [Clostridia bacterium]